MSVTVAGTIHHTQAPPGTLAGDITLACGATRWQVVSGNWAHVTCEPCREAARMVPLRRRTLPEQLLYLAGKLTEGYDPGLVAIALETIASEQEPPVPGDTPAAANCPVARPSPAPGSRSYRAPDGEDYGTCHTTIHLHDTGVAVILDHARKRRHVFRPPLTGETDADFLARIEREVWGR